MVRFVYDMAALPPSSRLQAFRDMLAGALNVADDAVDYAFADEDFTAAVRGRRLQTATLAVAATFAHRLTRTTAQARRATEEGLLFGFNLGSPLQSTQDGRETLLGAGDTAFVMKSRAYHTTTGALGRRVYLQCSKRELVDRFGPIDDLTATTFHAARPVLRLASAYFVGLAETFEQLDADMAEAVVGQGLDLLALAMREQVGGRLDNTTTYRSAMTVRVKAFMLSRLRDPNFSLAETAAMFHVSPRYINALLSDLGTSFGRFVLARRLEACRKDLANPARRHVSVTDVAFSCGFNDAAYFSRAFKARFDCTPRDYRRSRTGMPAERATLRPGCARGPAAR